MLNDMENLRIEPTEEQLIMKNMIECEEWNMDYHFKKYHESRMKLESLRLND